MSVAQTDCRVYRRCPTSAKSARWKRQEQRGTQSPMPESDVEAAEIAVSAMSAVTLCCDFSHLAAIPGGVPCRNLKLSVSQRVSSISRGLSEAVDA